MAHKHLAHAQNVVESFKQKLSATGRQHVGERHFDELTLLIESAISTAVLEALEHTADRLEGVAEEIRRSAEQI